MIIFKGCVGSVKLLDKDDNILAQTNDTNKRRLQYNVGDGDGIMEKVRLEGNCCFKAKERKKGGRTLLLEKNTDYFPKVKLNNS